jgi:hypothetical protein
VKFQASGFSIDVPDGAMDASAYTFSFPALGSFPPNVVIQFELGDGVDMNARREEVLERVESSYPDVEVRVQDEVRTRGDWEYFTIVAAFGEGEQRMVQKQLQLKAIQPKPTVYVFSGTDLASNFAAFEPYFDAMVRSFQANEVQRLN